MTTTSEASALLSIQSGDMLLAMRSASGFSGQDYAEKLSKIATDKSQGDIPRAQAIIRLSEIASALRVQEQFTQQPTISKPGSVSSSSIEQLLTNLVRDTNEQANVRSMAAALNFANILGKDHGERTRIAQYFSDKYQKDGKVSAEFNDFVSNSIQNLLVNEKSDSAKQIAAARVLLDLGVSIKINQLSPNANAIEQSIQNARMLKASEWIETKSGKYTSNPFAEVLGFSGKSTATDIAAFKSALQVQADNAKALQIMDKLAGLTSREEKEVFKKELMGYFLPSGKDIAEGSTGPAVSDKNAQLAAAMGLLFLAKEAGDLSPVNLGRRTVDVPAHYEKQAASDEGGNTYDRNVFVPASKSEQSLGAEQVFAALKAGMTDKNAPLLALTETMIFAGRLSGEELFGSLRDLAGDPNRSTNERAQALLRLAQLSSTMQFRSEMTAGRAAELVGSGRKDAIAVMQKLIQDPQTDGQLKALSASLLQLQMEPKYEDRNRILGELNTKLQSSSPAEFGASVREYLAREIKGADVERSLFASTAMKNLYDASKDQLNLSRSSLAGIVGGGDLSLAVRAMKELSSQDLSSLAAGDKLNLVDNLIKDCAYFTNSGKFLPKDLQLKMAELVKTIPSVAAIANDRQKQALESSLQALSNKGKIWTEPQLRAEAIKALQELGSQSSIPMFDQFIAGMPGDPNSRETSIQVREAALKAALAIDPLIRSKVSEWVKLEKDPVMLQRMQDVLSVSADSRSRAGFEGILPSDLIKRYPKSNELYGQTIPAADKELAAHKTAIDLLEKVQAIKAGDPSVSRDELIAKIFNIFRPDAAGIVNQEQSGVYHYYELEKAGFESFQGSTPDVVKKAAAMALLELTRREDGSNPDLLLQRSVDVPGFQKDVPNATDPMGAPLSNVTEYVEARKVDQRISRDEIMALLSKKDSTTILDRTDIKAASYDGYLLNNTELLPAEKFLQILKTDSDDSSKKQLAGNLMLDNWLKSVFERPLLNERSYQKIRQEDSAKASLDAYAGVSGMTKEIFSSSETIKQQRDLAFNKKLDELAHQRLKQIDKLTEIALKGGADGLMAKIAISQALQSSKIYAGGDDEFRLKAAKAVKTLLTASADVDVIQRAAADALKNNSESLSVEAQGVLLKALMENNNASSLPRSQLAETVLTGLESLVRTSSSKLDEKSAKLANDYIDALESLAYRPASDLMQRINKDYAGTALAERASKFLEKTTESTESAWADAAVDKLSTAKTRALIFEKQLSSTSSNDEIVKMIASTVKGLPIQGADDPRLPILQKEMDSQDDRVKIAASRAIIESQKAEFPAFLQAKELLAKFALSTTNATLRREALTALGKLNN